MSCHLSIAFASVCLAGFFTPVAEGASARMQIRASQLFGWQPINSEQLLIWTGKEEVWRLSIANGCPSLSKVRSIAVTTDRRHISAGRDAVRAGDQECVIREIAPPDPRQKRRSWPRKGFTAVLTDAPMPPAGEQQKTR